jgi:hypothetical protein
MITISKDMEECLEAFCKKHSLSPTRALNQAINDFVSRDIEFSIVGAPVLARLSAKEIKKLQKVCSE